LAGAGVIRFRVVLQATRFGRHSERSEESLFVLNCQEAEGFLTSFGMTDASFSPKQITPAPNWMPWKEIAIAEGFFYSKITRSN
jgi:hypothetical protein